MELILKLESEAPKVEFNYEDLKKEISKKVKKYENLEYTDETMGEAKTDRANLNKFKTAIETRRKEFKKECLKPYDEKEALIKELVEIIDKPITMIGEQITTYTDKRKDAKLVKIKEYWAEKAVNICELVTFEKIYSERWLNTTFSINGVEEAINNIIERTESDLEAIESLKSEHYARLQGFYLNSLDLSKTLQERTRIDEEQAKLEAFNKAKSEVAATMAKNASVVKEPVISKKETTEKVATPEVKEYNVCLHMTEYQRDIFKKFVIANNIKYTKVKGA